MHLNGQNSRSSTPVSPQKSLVSANHFVLAFAVCLGKATQEMGTMHFQSNLYHPHVLSRGAADTY